MNRRRIFQGLNFLVISLFLLPAMLFAQSPDWENHRIIEKNRMPGRATSYSFESESAALAGDRDNSRMLSLNGKWKFHFVVKSEDRQKDFFEPGLDVSEWDEISVPSSWEMAGYLDFL